MNRKCYRLKFHVLCGILLGVLVMSRDVSAEEPENETEAEWYDKLDLVVVNGNPAIVKGRLAEDELVDVFLPDHFVSQVVASTSRMGLQIGEITVNDLLYAEPGTAPTIYPPGREEDSTITIKIGFLFLQSREHNSKPVPLVRRVKPGDRWIFVLEYSRILQLYIVESIIEISDFDRVRELVSKRKKLSEAYTEYFDEILDGIKQRE